MSTAQRDSALPRALRERGVRRAKEPRPAINSPDHHYDTTSYVAPDQSYITFISIFISAGRTAPWNARLDGPGNGLGDTWRVPMAAVFEAAGRTPR
jgi:hypothetical protein